MGTNQDRACSLNSSLHRLLWHGVQWQALWHCISGRTVCWLSRQELKYSHDISDFPVAACKMICDAICKNRPLARADCLRHPNRCASDKNLPAVLRYKTWLLQENSALWVGEFDFGPMEFAGLGKVYHFPRDNNCDMIYCTVEGLSWIDHHRIAVTLDRAKADQPFVCTPKDQSIAVFMLPHGSWYWSWH